MLLSKGAFARVVLALSIFSVALPSGISPAIAATPTASLCSTGNYILLANIVTNGASTNFTSNYQGALVGDSSAVELAGLAASESGTVTNEPNIAAHVTAVADLGFALDELNSMASSGTPLQTAELSSSNSGTLPLGSFSPGIYVAPAALNIVASSVITLDAAGDPNAKFYFLIANAFTVGASVVINLANGALAQNVYWVAGLAGGDTTLGASAILAGNFIDRGTSTLGASIQLTGRVLVTDTLTIGASVLIQGVPGDITCPRTTPAPILSIVYTDLTLIPATAGSSYSDFLLAQTLSDAIASSQAITYQITSGTLPAGLSLDSQSGVISGTVDPTTPAGTISLTVSASSPGYPSVSSGPLSLQILPAPLLTALTPAFATATPTIDGFTMQITNYDPAFTWSGSNSAAGVITISSTGLVTVSALAPGSSSTLNISTSRTGYISGSNSSPVVVALTPILSIVYTDLTLIPATAGSSYSDFLLAQTLSDAIASSQAITYQITSGTLPAGLSLDSQSGVISGTVDPTTPAGTISLTVSASSPGYPSVSSGPLSLQILPAPLLTALTPAFATATPTIDGFTMQITNYDPAFTWSGSNSAAGVITISSTGLVTVSALAPGSSSTLNISTSRTGYISGSNSSPVVVSSKTAQSKLLVSNSVLNNPANTSVSLSASGGSGTGITTYSVSGTGCSLGGTNNNILSSTQIGTCVVTAANPGDATYLAATSSSVSFVFTAVTQSPAVTIGSTNLSIQLGSTGTLVANGGSGTGAYAFTTTSAGCTISSSTVSRTTAGTCVVILTKAASGLYLASTSVPVTFTFAALTAQAKLVISNTARSANLKSSFTLATSGGSGLGAVTYVISGGTAGTLGSMCVLAGTTLTATQAGTCIVIATKAANGIYSAVSSAALTFTFTKISQVITFNAVVAMVVGGSNQSLVAVSNAGVLYPVTFVATPASICTIIAGTINAVAGGTCSVTASQAGDATYTAAPNVIKTVAITQSQPTLLISNTALAGVVGTAFTVTTSGGSVAGTRSVVTTSSGCTVSGMKVSRTTAGTCSVVANNSANGIYSKASSIPVVITFTAKVSTSSFQKKLAVTPKAYVVAA